jgi:hypothetical protein
MDDIEAFWRSSPRKNLEFWPLAWYCFYKLRLKNIILKEELTRPVLHINVLPTWLLFTHEKIIIILHAYWGDRSDPSYHQIHHLFFSFFKKKEQYDEIGCLGSNKRSQFNNICSFSRKTTIYYSWRRRIWFWFFDFGYFIIIKIVFRSGFLRFHVLPVVALDVCSFSATS